MRRSSLAAALAVASLVAPVAAPLPALAQPKSAPNPTARDVARDIVNEAIKKDGEGDFDGAIELYMKAYTLVPQHVLLSNVAASHRKAGRPKEAWKFFCKYLEEDPSGENAAYARRNAKEIQRELGNIDVTDDNVCEPDKKPLDTVVLPPKQILPVEPSSSPGRGFRLVGLGAGAAGVISLGLGGYFGWKAKQKSDEISNHPMGEPWPQELRDIERDGQKAEDRQVLFMIVGGALVVGGGVLYVIGATRTSEGVAVQPTATPTSAGVALSGSF